MTTGLEGGAAAAGTVGTWALFLPPIEKVWNADPSGEPPHDLRSGQTLLFAMAVVFGGLQSAIARNPFPLLVAVGIAAGVASFYEYAYRQPPKTPTTG